MLDASPFLPKIVNWIEPLHQQLTAPKVNVPSIEGLCARIEVVTFTFKVYLLG